MTGIVKYLEGWKRRLMVEARSGPPWRRTSRGVSRLRRRMVKMTKCLVLEERVEKWG